MTSSQNLYTVIASGRSVELQGPFNSEQAWELIDTERANDKHYRAGKVYRLDSDGTPIEVKP